MVIDLKGKTAIVTGASRGIGRTLAEDLARSGAKVIVNYSSSPVPAEEVVESIRRQGGDALAIQADVGRIADIERLFQQSIEAFGRVDILVNNAGLMVTKPLANVTEEDFDKLFTVNVKGTYFTCQQAMRYMENNGRIINFSTSVLGVMFPAYSLYAGSKGAVEQFTRQLAKEFGPKGITINAVAPGPVNTELFNNGKTEEQIEGIRRMNSFGRLGETEDISGVVTFLASDAAQWITGQTIRVNGGFA
ncbi:SDR family oxidoreductase [Paenibacillus sp. TAB 01]|uniref:SDR family oxidoreductase n=1 Tax=Paenibacillus sp. TAB 01 TaxID=3368988 RepID=UPI0037505A58